MCFFSRSRYVHFTDDPTRHRLCEDGEVSPRPAERHDVTTVGRLRRQRRRKMLYLAGTTSFTSVWDAVHAFVPFIIVHTDYNEYTIKLSNCKINFNKIIPVRPNIAIQATQQMVTAN